RTERTAATPVPSARTRTSAREACVTTTASRLQGHPADPVPTPSATTLTPATVPEPATPTTSRTERTAATPVPSARPRTSAREACVTTTASRLQGHPAHPLPTQSATTLTPPTAPPPPRSSDRRTERTAATPVPSARTRTSAREACVT